MSRFPLWPSLAAILTIALAACGSTAAPASPSSAAAAGSQPAQASPRAASEAPASPALAPASAQASAAPSAAGWVRPMDVKPLPEAGIFKVVSETPAPGSKVPLFFMGAQG